MDSIPEVLFLEIFSYLTVSEAFLSIPLVCKFFRSITKNDFFLDSLLKINLRMYIPQRVHPSIAFTLLKDCVNSPFSANLDFRACSTDGGMDEDNESFFFGNIFEYSDKPWCTQENAFNANVSGVLSNTLQETSGYYWANQKVIEIVKEWLRRKNKKLYRKNEHIAIAIFKQVTSSFPLDAIAIDEPEPEKLKNLIREIYMNLKPFTKGAQKSRRFHQNSLVLDLDFDKDSVEISQNFAVINEIFISRLGEYTCPVETLMVFTSFTMVDILDQQLRNFNDLKKYEDLLEMKEFFKHVLPKKKIEVAGAEYCEFGYCHEVLKPVLWVKFVETNRIREISISLAQQVTGKYVYVKLIRPEDRREERNWLHDNMNIDCKSVNFKGRVISLI